MKVGVIGAGTMGQGIAKAFALVDGYQVADLESGDILELRVSEKNVCMIELSQRSFFERLEKLV